MEPQDVLALLERRYACRDFQADRKIPQELFNVILEAGRLSPSSYGFEPWRFLVIEEASLRQALMPLAPGAQRTLPSASHFVIILARRQASLRYDAPYIEHLLSDIQQLPSELYHFKRQRYQTFQEEDFDLLSSERATFDWACKQAYIAMSHMLQVAALLDIDSLAMEGFNQAAVTQLLADQGVMDSQEWGVAVMVAFGYGTDDQPAKSRQSIEEVVHWVK